MQEFFHLYVKAAKALTQPKAAASAIYHNIMQRGQRALRKPVDVAQELRADYTLNLPMFFAFFVYMALFTQFFGGIGELLQHHHEGKDLGIPRFIAMLILTPFMQGLGAWYIAPFVDKIGYRIFGLSVTMARAREVSFAAALPYVSTLVVVLNVGVTLLISYIDGLAWLFLPIMPVFLIAAVQSFRLRKNLLETTYGVAVGGPLLVWFGIGLFLMLPLMIFLIFLLGGV